MSEEFDKEAERERLREKYESDSAEREVTERMSQLLLQGATMTNTHCDTCGSPIFRYQGQEFCPVCQAGDGAPAGEQPGARATGDAGGASDAQADGTQAVQAEGTQTTQAEGTQAAKGDATQAAPDHSASDAAGQNVPQPSSAPASVGAASTGTAELGGGTAAANRDTRDVGTALSATIVALAERARGTEDPRQAKELLEAAHEAAETLATLSGE